MLRTLPLPPEALTGNAYPGINQWVGGVLAPNGLVYSIPYGASSVLIVDPVKLTVDASSIRVNMSGTGVAAASNWYGGVLGPDGRIYGIPLDSSSVLIVDPAASTTDTETLHDATWASMSDKWCGGVLAGNGKIYGIPYDASTVLVIDPLTSSMDSTTLVVAQGHSKWVGGVLGPNGKVYGIPLEADAVLIIDPISHAVDTTSILKPGSGYYEFGVMLPTGQLFAIPSYGADSVLVVDVATNATSNITIPGRAPPYNWGWSGGVLGPDGLIYGTLPKIEFGTLVILF